MGSAVLEVCGQIMEPSPLLTLFNNKFVNREFKSSYNLARNEAWLEAWHSRYENPNDKNLKSPYRLKLVANKPA